MVEETKVENINDGTVKIKKTHLIIAVVIVASLAFGILIGHYMSAPKTQKTIDPGTLFQKYATDLKLDVPRFKLCLDSGKYSDDVNSDYTLGTSIGVQGTPSFIINGQMVPGAVPYDSFKAILDKELLNPANRTSALNLINPNDPILGNKDAPIVMVEFSDFQCPFCGSFFSNTEMQLRKDYIETGKVFFAYKDFPLSQIHPNAKKAAEAAQCAKEQGKFWEYHDVLFQNQAQWAK